MATPPELYAASARALARVGIDHLTLEHIADDAGMTGADLEIIYPSVQDALREMVIGGFEDMEQSLREDIRSAKDGSEAMTRYVRKFVAASLEDLDLFRAAYMTRQVVGNERFGLDPELVRTRLIPRVNALLDGLEEKLIEDKGPTQLAGGIHPRRLAFVTHMLATGVATIAGLARSTTGTMKHTEENMVREATMALGAATSTVRQLGAINEAARALAQLRTEKELFELAPKLLKDALDFDEANVWSVAGSGAIEHPLAQRALDEGRTVFDEPGTDERQCTEMATPLRYEGAILVVLSGSCSRALGERDEAHIDTLASMMGLAHENVRFYEDLQSRVDERTRELREAQAALVQSERLAASATLVAGLAHEINTPMGSVLASTATIETAIDKLTDESAPVRTRERMAEVIRSAASTIRAGGERVGGILDKLKRFSRLDASERARVDLNECVRDVIGVLEPKLGNCRVTLNLGPLPELSCAPAELNQVFLQVLQNAAEASPTVIEVATRHEGDELVIRVTDDGEGIDAIVRDKVFDPGFTTRGVGVGAGMGLAIVHRVMQDHGGSVVLETPAAGTTVVLTLPVR